MLVQKMQEKEIREKTNLLPLFIYPLFLIFLISCDPIDIPNPPQPSPVLSPVSDKLVASIYFDATLSMQGFVVPSSTHYTRICPYLGSVIVSGWDDETVDFFRFGEQVESLTKCRYLTIIPSHVLKIKHLFSTECIFITQHALS